MPSPKIVQFPSAAAKRPKRQAVLPQLFSDPRLGKGKVAYLHIEGLSEADLLHAIARNSITGLIDLRPRPVFERPNFEHKKVVGYLYSHRVQYFEYALFQNELRPSESRNDKRKKVEKELDALLASGLTLCLYDEDSKERGWLERTRHILRDRSSFVAELHPKSLSGV